MSKKFWHFHNSDALKCVTSGTYVVASKSHSCYTAAIVKKSAVSTAKTGNENNDGTPHISHIKLDNIHIGHICRGPFLPLKPGRKLDRKI